MSFDIMTYGNVCLISLPSKDKKNNIDIDFYYLFGFHTIIIITELITEINL